MMTLPASLRSWIHLLLAFILGATGTLSFSPFDLWPFAIISLAGLQWLGFGCTPKRAAGVGFFWGLGLFLTGISWVYISMQHFGGMSMLASAAMVLLLASYISLYPMLFSLLVTKFWPKITLTRVLIAAPALWQFTEFLRGWVMTGFPWLQFGYTQIDGPLKGIAPIAGVEAITFLLVMTAGCLAYAIHHRKLIPAIISIAIMVLPLPLKMLQWYEVNTARSAKVTMIQGNILQSLKWQTGQLEITLKTYMDNTLSHLDDSQLIIWPEAAITSLETQQQPFLTQLDSLVRETDATLLTGIIEARYNTPRYDYFNTLIVLGDKQEPYSLYNKNRYHKYHLVIFGEYVPFESVLRPITTFFDLPMSMMQPGERVQEPIVANGYKLTPAICYEIILGQRLRNNLKPDTDFILTISNDAWFGSSIGPWQHFQMARIRALELGRPLLRATNNGITTAIDASGNVIKQLPQFVTDTLQVDIAPTTGITPYARFGNTFVWIVAGIFILIAVFRRKLLLVE